MRLATLRAKHTALAPVFTERSRRLWAASEARALGHGGIGVVERATGISRPTIQRGLRELEADAVVPPGRDRRPGGGRKSATVLDATLLRDLDALVEPTAPGDPDSPLRWSCKSTRTLAVALHALGHSISHTVVAELLHQLGYSLQGNVKTREGRQHPDRDAQFRYIAATVKRVQRRGQPAISVDTKKKELVGDFKNGGRLWRRKGEPDRVRVHDFIIRDPEHGKAIPYGVYDLRRDEGWVSIGIDHDTASFAVNAIRRWWRQMGRDAYPRAQALVITADAGGSNGPRVRLWKWELQQLANRSGLGHHGLSLPTGDEQVEPDRASPLLAHRHELARHAARQSRRHRQPDCLDAQSVGAPRPIGTRSAALSGWRDGDRRADDSPPPQATRVSRRLELYDSPRVAAPSSSITYFLTAP